MRFSRLHRSTYDLPAYAFEHIGHNSKALSGTGKVLLNKRYAVDGLRIVTIASMFASVRLTAAHTIFV
jgi:hypothetical protein